MWIGKFQKSLLLLRNISNYIFQLFQSYCKYFFTADSAPYKDNNNNFSAGVVDRILEYERSIPSRYKVISLKNYQLSFDL